ncbi:MAG: class I SAM-dependent methyltransferase [Candidatus Omnitrophota bacterium]
MGKTKENVLLKAVIKIFTHERPGKVLDLGCATGDYSLELHRMGFDVTAADVCAGFKYTRQIKFVRLWDEGSLPFEKDCFDFILLAEVIEHLKEPHRFMKIMRDLLKPEGKLILSTPNILNLKSRIRFLTEGTYEYFREPSLDHVLHNAREGIDVSQVHIMPMRYHELEFLLNDSGFTIVEIKTSKKEGWGLFFLLAVIWFQLKLKAKRSARKGGVDYTRINRILLMPELLYGRHLIVKAFKNGQGGLKNGGGENEHRNQSK